MAEFQDCEDPFADWDKPVKSFDQNACHAAIRGELIPDDLTLNINKLAVVRGILHHPGFGKKLHGYSPLFTRALNARSIMSNVIPAMSSPEEFPYCIWYPDTATENTYRELSLRYPSIALFRASTVFSMLEVSRCICRSP